MKFLGNDPNPSPKNERALVNPSRSAPETSWAVPAKFQPFSETSVQIDRIALQDVARRRLAELIRDTFPASSDAQTARQAAAHLGVFEKSVLNWLAGSHSAPFDIVFAIVCFSGVFRAMEILSKDESRFPALNLFARGVRRVTGR